ncbi:hypothetical protein HS088_TW08G00480 [Tripterygium wilfordii]|uniref:Uncharacterized protein n=1 Tax=Tripterygium wilfordii TaxID=458696 RepID=A0A7J7DC04_TRIWF|nr:hypothetical protein HS088_TW08G00480 [Tripterygium wilfordii]
MENKKAKERVCTMGHILTPLTQYTVRDELGERTSFCIFSADLWWVVISADRSSPGLGFLADDQGSSSKPFRSFGLSIFRKMREKVRSTEGIHESGNADVELFQKQVTERFHELSIVSAEGLLSVEWIKNLLDVFMSCQEEFRVILLKNRDQVLKSPLDKMISDFFESSLKALDICNVTRDGIENLRSWQKQLEIVQCALHSPQRYQKLQKKMNFSDLEMDLVLQLTLLHHDFNSSKDGDGDKQNERKDKIISCDAGDEEKEYLKRKKRRFRSINHIYRSTDPLVVQAKRMRCS